MPGSKTGLLMSAAGFGELVQFARTRPHPAELLAAMPDELVSAIGLVGGLEQVEQRLEAYRQAGADEICLVPATAGDPGGAASLRAVQGKGS